MKRRAAAVGLFGVAAAAAVLWAQEQQTAPPAQPPAQAPAQQPAPPPPVPPNAAEMTTHDVASSFVSRVNLVSVPVVVRDAKGRSVGNLTKANFALFDKGKPQQIARFVVEDTRVVSADSAAAKHGPLMPGEAPPPTIVAPERYVAYLFDDINLNLDGLVRVRKAAEAHLQTLPPTDRAAIYSSSGEVALDFTDNRELLHVALIKLRPSIMTRVGALNAGEQQIFGALQNLQQIIRRMSTVPGQRLIMMISPGFFTQDPQYFGIKADLIERAIRAKVIISALDARGLYTDPAFDVAPTHGAQARTLTGALLRSDVLAEVSSGTGGTFYENSNDYDEGFRRIASAPEYIYILGFSPQNLKSDGSFHGLKVSLRDVKGLAVEARKGYYAPRKSDDAAAVAKEEVESALFSREELKELPIAVQTQFFKENDNQAKLAVLVHLDIKTFKFRKADGRNNNNITVVSGLFDRNGNYLQGIQKLLELHLKDETLPKLPNGLTLRTVFDVHPGPYLVRTVVRDSEGEMMSATNGAVWIQ